jgi:predicted nucleic acid-binding protein
MNGNSLLIDTNIILYFLGGDDTLVPLLQENDRVVSIITEVELLGYSGLSEKEQTSTEAFLNTCSIINITTDIKQKAIKICRTYNMKLPDAFIMATALSMDVPLLTADKDFQGIKDDHLILYKK